MTAIDASAEFRERRSRTWRAVRWWIPIGLAAGIAFALVPGGEDRAISQNEFTFMLGCFVVIALSILMMIRAVTSHYRCPKCNEIPMTSSFKAGLSGISYRRSVDLNPTECSNCGALLKAGAQSSSR
ncbi:MAG TPA: hypothetical protein VH856_10630 [Steroidobacteraceae bacterium]|jgi:hypothetical protein